MTVMTGIAPIVQTVEVKTPPERAFEAFTGSMGDWWPKGMTIGGSHHVAVVNEPRAGGRWFERDAEGRETDWGRVLAWEPPGQRREGHLDRGLEAGVERPGRVDLPGEQQPPGRLRGQHPAPESVSRPSASRSNQRPPALGSMTAASRSALPM